VFPPEVDELLLEDEVVVLDELVEAFEEEVVAPSTSEHSRRATAAERRNFDFMLIKYILIR
jgi:hypothetical protein